MTTLTNLKNMPIYEKENISLFLAGNLGYTYHLTQKIKLNEHDENLVWCLIDFGYQREQNIMEGKCSLQASIDFDMSTWEEQINQDIKELIAIYEKNCIKIPMLPKL